jgi:hypothetical protein
VQEWIAGILAKMIEIIGVDFSAWIKKFIDQWTRSQAQEKTAEEVAADQGKPRDEKVNQDELNDINS